MMRLSEYEGLPPGLIEREARRLHEVLPGPSLIHLPGRRPQPLFVSVLLHGNEDTGWEAVRRVLARPRPQGLPRALSLFIGNVQAARLGVRRLDAQVDYNRVWPGTPLSDLPEAALMRTVTEAMAARRVFASVDIHNNTGRNPHYACVNRLQPRFLQLATLFSRIVVYFLRPLGVQSAAFAPLCPAVTIECGRPGQAGGVEHAADYIEACLHLADIPAHPVAAHDLDLYHTVATVRVPEHVSIGFDGEGADLVFPPDLDALNFRELPAGSVLARLRRGLGCPVEVTDETGADVSRQLIDCRDGQVRLRRRLMPAMLTTEVEIIRQDCLCYLMERLPHPR
ncbi:MAG: M14 family metallopeptidase [Thiobacillaceae bacterium]|nr:M14 family metallopeptidase [Thiobacillaceae bacterium]